MKTRRITSIYCIECLINNKKYIGQSIFTQRRFNSHKKDLRDNEHCNRHLQNAYNKYGLENFRFYILEEFDLFISSEDLTEREKYYIHLYNSNNEQYVTMLEKLLVLMQVEEENSVTKERNGL